MISRRNELREKHPKTWHSLDYSLADKWNSMRDDTRGFLSISDCRGFCRMAALCDMLRKSCAMTRTSATYDSNWLNVWRTSVVLVLLWLQIAIDESPFSSHFGSRSQFLSRVLFVIFILSLHRCDLVPWICKYGTVSDSSSQAYSIRYQHVSACLGCFILFVGSLSVSVNLVQMHAGRGLKCSLESPFCPAVCFRAAPWGFWAFLKLRPSWAVIMYDFVSTCINKNLL